MKLIIEEIVGAHPSGANAGGYQRVARGVLEVDQAGAMLITERDNEEPLWLGSYKDRRAVLIVEHRVCASSDELKLIVDVIDSNLLAEIHDEIRSCVGWQFWASNNKVGVAADQRHAIRDGMSLLAAR